MGLRILMLAPEPFFTPRGTPFSVLYRIKALLALGHRVDLVTYPFGEDVPLPGLSIHRCPPVAGIRSVGIGPSLPKILLDLQLYRTARRLVRRHAYDYLHTHEEASILGAWWRRRDVPHLYDMHALLSQHMYNFRVPLAPLAAWVWRRIENWVFRRSDAVITICPELGAALHQRRVRVPYTVIENAGIAEFIDRVDPGEVRQLRTRWGDSAYVAAYIGTFEPYQGLDLLLEAIGRIKRNDDSDHHLHWVLAGVDPGAYPEWQRRIRDRSLADCVELVPRMSPHQAAVLQKTADLLVSPRTSGVNTPLKIYSYLASGTPIVATRHPSHTQVLDDRLALLVEPNVDGLVAGIRYARNHPTDMQARARAARAHFETHYRFEVLVEKTGQILERMLDTHSRHGVGRR